MIFSLPKCSSIKLSSFNVNECLNTCTVTSQGSWFVPVSPFCNLAWLRITQLPVRTSAYQAFIGFRQAVKGISLPIDQWATLQRLRFLARKTVYKAHIKAISCLKCRNKYKVDFKMHKVVFCVYKGISGYWMWATWYVSLICTRTHGWCYRKC